MKSPVILALVLFPILLFSQTVEDYTVQVTALVQTAPASVILSWPAHTDASNFQVHRKAPDAISWGTTLATLPDSATSWTDTNVQPGEVWEYRIRKTANGYAGYGYIQAGIEAPATEHRETIILVVDSTYKTDLASRLNRLVEDLRGDGWSVIRHDVDRNDTVIHIKDLIRADYNAAPNEVKSVFLLGHVPVPYSGNFGNNAPWFTPPDAHSNHGGAWPADLYYGEMDGTWTDFSVTNTTASRTANHNVPGDGKFDQNNIPGNVELAVGRVDMADLPAFPANEKDLLAHYLDKDHAYRHKQFSVAATAVIDDNFGVFSGEVFAANGWRNFAPLLGPTNVSSGDFRTSLNGGGHQWTYGCGGGSYSSCSGVGTTAQIAGDSLKGVFSMLFGSYFGDWDSPDNFLRAPLANKGTVLACAWAGRPHWQFHPMGQGETLGECARMSQNNQNLYFASYFYRMPHIALMGDPSLRMHIIAPPGNLTVTPVMGNTANELSWTSSPDSILGYYLYRSSQENGPYQRITPDPVTSVTFIDSCPDSAWNYYQVLALQLESGPSGSYYNLSQGMMGTGFNTVSYPQAAFAWSIAGDSLLLSNTSSGATLFRWDFGDGDSSFVENPVHAFAQDGSYTVRLIISDGCRKDTLEETIQFTGFAEPPFAPALRVYPNPTRDRVKVEFRDSGSDPIQLELFNLTGGVVCKQQVMPDIQGSVSTTLDLSQLPGGVYLLHYSWAGGQGALQLLKQ